MAASPASLPLDQHLCFALYGASMAIGRLYKPILDEWGITYPQYLLLSALWEKDGQLIGALAERLALEPSTITPLVTRLAASGFVERERDPSNGRQVIVRLREQGRALQERSACLGAALLEAAGMPMERLRELNREVRALRDAVAATSEAAPQGA